MLSKIVSAIGYVGQKLFAATAGPFSGITTSRFTISSTCCCGGTSTTYYYYNEKEERRSQKSGVKK